MDEKRTDESTKQGGEGTSQPDEQPGRAGESAGQTEKPSDTYQPGQGGIGGGGYTPGQSEMPGGTTSRPDEG